MKRVLFFLVIFFNFSFSLEVHESLFPEGEELKNFILNDGLKGKALFLNNKNTFVTLEGTYDIKINFFNLKNGKKFFQIKVKESRITDVSIAKKKPYLVYVEQADERPIVINVFDIKNKKIIHRLKLKERITSICISNNAKYILYTTYNNKIYIYDREEHKQLSMFRIQKSIKNIKIDTFNKYIFTLEEDSIVMYDFKTFQKLQKFHLGEKIYLNKFDISRDGKYLLSVSNRNNLKVWDIKNRKLEIELEIPYIEDAKFTNDSKKIIYGEKEKLKILDILTNKSIFVATDKNLKKIYSISVGDNSKILVNDRFLINIETFNLINLSKKFGSGIEHYIEESFYIKKLNSIFSRDKESGIKVWNLQENNLEYIIDKENKINDMALSRDEKYLIFSTDRTLKVWDVEAKEFIKEFIEENSTIQNIAISISGKRIVFKADKKLKILDFKLWKIITEIEDESFMYQLNFLKEEHLIVSNYQEIKVFDIKTKKLINHKNKNNQWIEVYKDSPYYRVYFYTKLKSEIKDILTNKVVATFLENNYVYEIFNEKAYVGDLEDRKLDVWDLKQQKIVDEKKQQYYETININNSIALMDTNWSDMFDEEKILEEIFYDNRSWAIIDYQTKKIYRYGNKDFLLDINTFEPLVSNDINVSKDDVKIFFEKENIKLSNNDSNNFTIQVQNISNHKIYWIEPFIEDENFILETDSIVVLEPNEIKNIKVSIQYNGILTQSFFKDVTLKMRINDEIINLKKMKIDIKKQKDIELENIEFENIVLIAIKMHKHINKNLTNIKVVLSEGNKSIKNNLYYNMAYPPIETNESITVYIPNDKTFFYTWWGKGHDFTVMVNANEIKPHIFKKHIKFDMPLGIYILLSIPAVLLLIFIYYIYMGFFVRNIKKIMNNPNTIFDMNLNKLSYYKKLLKRRMDKNYYENNFSYILGNDIDRLSKFFELSNEERAKIISEKVNGKIKKIDEDFFELTLNKNFAIKVKKILLYFPSDSNIEKIYKTLENRRSEGILVIDKNEKEQQLFADSLRLNELPNVIVTMPKNIKIFLLQENHSLTLSKILSLKLDRKIISPYKTKNGVQNESYFFGREQILQQITEGEPSNYLLVGARQIGKTSILFALERMFKAKNELEVIHMTLSSGSPIRKIALKLNMDRDSTLEEIEEYILSSDKPYLFLIDEVDGFIKNEEQNSYKILDTFRSLTQEGKAYFIMAGFWELYYQATYDYQSPIKNFGEIITVDKLEDDACVKLLLEPMSALNLNFKNQDKNVRFIINSLGKRANLIATIANEIVENLDRFRFEIDDNDIGNALNSRKVLANFNSWQKLTDSEFKSYIDRFIVYYTIGLNSFTIRKIINLFKKIGVEKVTIDEIKESLDRLELSYILAKEGQSYFYTIPLFQEHLRRDDIKAILDEMIDKFRKKHVELE